MGRMNGLQGRHDFARHAALKSLHSAEFGEQNAPTPGVSASKDKELAKERRLTEIHKLKEERAPNKSMKDEHEINLAKAKNTYTINKPSGLSAGPS